MTWKTKNPKTKCLECGEIVPYQGRGRPRLRHKECMTPKQQYLRKYGKTRMSRYYARGHNMAKQIAYMRKRRAKENE